MTPVQHFASALMALAVAAVGVAQESPAGQTAQDKTAPAVALIGCVERVLPVTPPPGTTAPAYKLTDVQPSSAVAQKPKVYAKEYFVVGPESIAFSKYQNQWVEITGTITAPPRSVPATGEKPATPALSTVTVATIKVITNECK
jgi:hypothetical protein